MWCHYSILNTLCTIFIDEDYFDHVRANWQEAWLDVTGQNRKGKKK